MRIDPNAPTPDWDQLADALHEAGPGVYHFYDRQTARVLLCTLDDDDPAELESLRDEPERYVEIAPIASREGHRWMERFTATVMDRRLRELLDVALVGKGAFRRFKDVLLRFPEERTRWFLFERTLVRLRVERWLADEDIAVGGPPPWGALAEPDEPAAFMPVLADRKGASRQSDARR